MVNDLVPDDALRAAADLKQADILIGIPSFNNSRTIAHVVRAVHAGLAKYFPQFTSVIINSDGGSRDGTREAMLSSRIEDSHLLLVSTPLYGVHRMSYPYHGIPGKGSAFRLIFQMAKLLGAKACAVVDADLRSITPEWIDLLVRPVLHAGFDFVAPYYHRHKYDGTITNSIVYPLTRALYGRRVRQPIGGDFGLSRSMFTRYLERDDWETDVARYGIDVWMTTIALAEEFRVCQSFLGAKLHDAKDPGADLSEMLEQVVGSVLSLMREYEAVWSMRTGSEHVDLFGFRYDVGLDPVAVNVERMVSIFRRGCEELAEVWEFAFSPETFRRVSALSRVCSASVASFEMDDELWARLLYDLAVAYRRHPMSRAYLLRSLTPLYMGRVASFVIETRDRNAAQVEDRIEQLCLCFERHKTYLIQLWTGNSAGVISGQAAPEIAALKSNVEV